MLKIMRFVNTMAPHVIPARSITESRHDFAVRLPDSRLLNINSADAWEKRMAEGVAALARYRAQAKAAEAQGVSGNG